MSTITDLRAGHVMGRFFSSWSIEDLSPNKKKVFVTVTVITIFVILTTIILMAVSIMHPVTAILLITGFMLLYGAILCCLLPSEKKLKEIDDQ